MGSFVCFDHGGTPIPKLVPSMWYVFNKESVNDDETSMAGVEEEVKEVTWGEAVAWPTTGAS